MLFFPSPRLPEGPERLDADPEVKALQAATLTLWLLDAAVGRLLEEIHNFTAGHDGLCQMPYNNPTNKKNRTPQP